MNQLLSLDSELRTSLWVPAELLSVQTPGLIYSRCGNLARLRPSHRGAEKTSIPANPLRWPNECAQVLKECIWWAGVSLPPGLSKQAIWLPAELLDLPQCGAEKTLAGPEVKRDSMYCSVIGPSEYHYANDRSKQGGEEQHDTSPQRHRLPNLI